VSHLTCCALWKSRKLAEDEGALEKTEDRGLKHEKDCAIAGFQIEEVT